MGLFFFLVMDWFVPEFFVIVHGIPQSLLGRRLRQSTAETRSSRTRIGAASDFNKQIVSEEPKPNPVGSTASHFKVVSTF